ncbi:MAG: ABC transporter ATP-binding protein [Desulfurococcaceae archaeon]|uniref:ABC transporter ATP-binding protein n=1 Tax=Staphylothermus marinus TaxID=2280 RepID=A0A7C4NP97_STAMA
MSKAIVVKSLRKKYTVKKRGLFRRVYEDIEALRGVSFEVNYGEVVGLLGPNGAGKTTTIKIIATLLLPDAGEVYVDGFDAIRQPNEVRKRIGLMLTVEKGFYTKLTGIENLEYFGILYGLSRREARARALELIKLVELDKLGGDVKLLEEFSLGMKARLSFARALINNAPILLLDEPTLGLDPPSARKIRELVKKLAREEGKAVLYTTHNMFEAEIVCDRILLINKGVIVAVGSPNELKRLIPYNRVINMVVKGDGDAHSIIEEFGLRGLSEKLENGLFTIKIHVDKPEEILNEIVKKYVSKGFNILSLKIEEPTLEDVFIYFSEGS